MYSLWTRANAVFFYGITALLVAAIASGVSTYTFKPQPVIHAFRINSLKSLKSMKEPTTRSDVDRAVFTFDLDADLQGVWNWNVKQLFLHVTANYSTGTDSDNEIVVWDKIIERKNDSHVVLNNAFIKYPVIHHDKELRGAPLSISLHWDVMPITGTPYFDWRGVSTVTLPETYCDEGLCDRGMKRGEAQE